MTFCKSNVLAFAPTSILLKSFMFLSSPTLISVVSSDDDFMFLKNFPCSVFINLSRAGYKRWIIGSVDWKGTRNSWKSWATKATNNTYASMICLLKEDLIRKYLFCFLNLFFKVLLQKKFEKVLLQIFPLLQTMHSHMFHTDPTGLSMFLDVLCHDITFDGHWSIVFMPGTRAFEQKMQVLKKVV